MTVPITLNNVTTFQNDTTAATTVNNNSTAITTAMGSALNTAGDKMLGNLDMNSNQILNLPAPTTVNSPARLIDVSSNPTIVIPVTGTSGHAVPYLDGTNTWSGVQTFNNTDVALKGSSTGVTTLSSANAGASNFTLTVPAATDTLTVNTTAQTLTNKTLTSPIISSISNTGILTLPTSTDTLVGRATTDTLTNKTINSATNTMQLGGVTMSPGQLAATATNDNATAGNIGEYITSSGTNVALTSGTTVNLLGTSLTAGDWDVWGWFQLSNSGTTTYTAFTAGVSTTNGVIQAPYVGMNVNIAGATYNFPVPMVRLSFASTTTIYICVNATFTGGSPTTSGNVYARRVR